MRAFLRDFVAVALTAYVCVAAAQITMKGQVLEYPAEVLRVIDGDTVEARLELGLGVSLVQHVRLYGIDTPELRGPERKRALEAKAFTEQWVQDCDALTVTVVKQRGKYGRIVGDLKCLEMSLSHDLWQAGLARKVDW